MTLHPDGAACMAEEDLGIQLEEWDGSEENQDAPAISAIEDSLLFESKIWVWFCEAFNGNMKESKQSFQSTVVKSVKKQF